MPPVTADTEALLRLKNEIAKDRARLAEQLALLEPDDEDEEPPAGALKGQLSRVFSLMSA